MSTLRPLKKNSMWSWNKSRSFGENLCRLVGRISLTLWSECRKPWSFAKSLQKTSPGRVVCNDFERQLRRRSCRKLSTLARRRQYGMLRVIPTNINSTFGWQREEIPCREQTKYRGRGISQQFELFIMRSKVKPVWRVQNLTDSSIFSEERHFKEYRRRSQSLFLFPTDLGRSKRLCSQGNNFVACVLNLYSKFSE